MKIKVLILILGLIFSVLITACSGNESPANETTPAQGAEETLPEKTYLDDLGARDFKGEKFTIIIQDADSFKKFYASEELTGEPIQDASYMRDRQIEERYNIKIEYIPKNYDAIAGLMRSSLASGDYLCDMVINAAIILAPPVMEGLLYNLAALPYLTLDSSPWWSKLMYDNLKFDGKLFIMSGDIFPGMYMAPAAMYVNQKLLVDYNITDNLYEMVFTGTWTLDVLERLTKDLYFDLNGDGIMTDIDDFFGSIHQDHSLASNTFCAAMGIKLSTIKDNTIIVDLISETAVERIERLSSFFKPYVSTDGSTLISETFMNDKAIFMTHYLESAFNSLRTMESDFGILPVPKYNEAQATYNSFTNPYNGASISVPFLINPEKVGFIMEAMGYLSYEMLRPNVYELTLKTKLARDTASMDIVDIIIETSYLDLNGLYNFGGSTDIVRNTLFDKKPLLSAYQSAESRIQGDIDKYIDSISGE